ncbi:MAG: zinc ABC transporter substrate-binding protein [Myxococcota bacterium]
MLRLTIPYVRSLLTWPWWKRLGSNSGYYDTELVHNLYVSILEPEFIDHDLWFLAHQARWYVEKCDSSLSPNYDSHLALIAELFELVPLEQRRKISWSGPIDEHEL